MHIIYVVNLPLHLMFYIFFRRQKKDTAPKRISLVASSFHTGFSFKSTASSGCAKTSSHSSAAFRLAVSQSFFCWYLACSSSAIRYMCRRQSFWCSGVCTWSTMSFNLFPAILLSLFCLNHPSMVLSCPCALQLLQCLWQSLKIGPQKYR